MINPFSWFISLREKLLALLAFGLFSLGIGWHLHTIWDGYIDSGTVKHQLERAKEAPAEISKFHQALRKTNVEKTECFNTPIPDDVLKLLR